MGESRRNAFRVTMDDVARAAGVSRATVSRVLTGNSSVSEETIVRVDSAVERLGYVPNPAARSLAGYRSKVPTVGLLLRDPVNIYYGVLFAELQRHAAENGFQLVASIPTQKKNSVDELSALSSLLSMGVDGIFLATGSINPSDVEGFLDKVPMISVGRPELRNEITAVGFDETKHGKIIASNVLGYGHRRVGVVVVDEDYSVPENRRGVSTIQELTAAGAVVRSFPVSSSSSFKTLSSNIIALVKRGEITCVVFPNDRRALRFLGVAQSVGVDVPQDVSVVGVDGISREVVHAGLATVQIPVNLVAARASRVMGSRIKNPRQVVTHENFAGMFLSGDSLGVPNPLISEL